MFKVTPTAYDMLLKLVDEQKQSADEKLFIRAEMGLGWGGPQLRLALEEQPLDSDQVVKVKDLRFLINELDQVYFENTKLDLVKDVFGIERFTMIRL